jgi:phosphate transport system substrate-binding protein
MRVAVTLHGPDSTMASVVSGVAGLALLALGYVALLYRNEQVNPLALAVRASAPYVLPTKDSVTDHSYPLACKITMFLNRAPGRAVDTKLKEYLHYMLSREGQEAVIREGGGYLPIIAPFAADELKKLD